MNIAVDREPALDPASADWFAWLPADARIECQDELAALAAAGLVPGQLDYDAVWWGWCSTAEIHTEPALMARLRQPHPGDGGLVPRPE
jgi:hypothetical protein